MDVYGRDAPLLKAYGTSVLRPQLRKLSRLQLRGRLAELGAAKSESQGLFHGELVDVVAPQNFTRATESNPNNASRGNTVSKSFGSMLFHLPRGRSAKDPQKIRGRPLRKT